MHEWYTVARRIMRLACRAHCEIGNNDNRGNNTMNIELPAYDFLQALKFAASAAAKPNTIRAWTGTVLFDVHDGTLSLCGTDGHRLALATLETPNAVDQQFVANIDHVQALLKTWSVKSAKFWRERTVQLGVLPDGVLTVTQRYQGGAMIDQRELQSTGDSWPDGWRRALQSNVSLSGTHAFDMNARYMADAARACELLANSRFHGVRVDLRGADGVVTFVPNICEADYTHIKSARYCVMPMRL